MVKRTSTGTAPSKEALKKIRRQLHDAASFVRSREATEALSRVTFNELIATSIKELAGDDSTNLRTQIKLYENGREIDVSVKRTRVHGRITLTHLDRINALQNTIAGIIEGVKKIDPEALSKAIGAQRSKDVNR